MEPLFVDNPGPIAEHDELMYYNNGPLLFLMTLGPEGNRVLCVALQETPQALPHLVVELTSQQEERLLRNLVPMQSLCLECVSPPGLGAYFLVDSSSDVWELRPLSTIPVEYLPGEVYLDPRAAPSS